MTLLPTATAFVMAMVLLWAALQKTRDPAPLASTIHSLGMKRALALPAARFVTSVELVVAVALLFRPDSLFTQLGVVALAAVFALAGLRALALEEPIPCNCFGAAGYGDLGVTQLIVFILWAAGAGMIHFGLRQRTPLSVGALSFATVALGIAVARVIGVWRRATEARGDRHSAEETYIWLPSH